MKVLQHLRSTSKLRFFYDRNYLSNSKILHNPNKKKLQVI
jgi:hypothetical protein